MMKAIVINAYGGPEVLQVMDVPRPTAKANEILVQVRASSVGFGDLMARDFKHVTPAQFNMPAVLWAVTRLTLGINRPNNLILGAEFAGDVVAVGEKVTRFKVGDAVFGYRGPSFGCNAEYVCITETGVVAHLPANLGYEEAASVPYGALTALNLLRKVDLGPGKSILINGASGSLGSAAVQLAKGLGAEVTGVCSTGGLDFVRSLGADHVIDYTREDFTQNGQTYDVIFDILGRSGFEACAGSLKAQGRYLMASFKMKGLFQMLRTRGGEGKQVICALSMESQADLEAVKALLEAGTLRVTLDQRYRLDQAAEAHAYMMGSHKQGAVILTALA